MSILHAPAPASEMEKRAVDAKLFILWNAVDRGAVHPVACLLEDAGFLSQVSAFGENAQRTIEATRAWLAEAEAFEAVHGPGSKRDLGHPWFAENQPAIDSYLQFAARVQ